MFQHILKFLIRTLESGKGRRVLGDTAVWMTMTVNPWKYIKICLIVLFQNATEKGTRLLNSRSRKISLVWRFYAIKENNGACLVTAKSNAHNYWGYCAYAANQLPDLFFISLLPGQNADHAAFQTQQYCMIDRKKELSCPLKKWGFNLICKGLIQLNMIFSLLYPQKLRAYFEDRSKLFEFPQGALDLSMLCPGIQMKIDFEMTIFFLGISDGKSKRCKAKHRHLL